MPFERPIKQTTGKVFKEGVDISKKGITCFQRDPFNIFMNDMPTSPFSLHILSFFTQLFLSYLPRLGASIVFSFLLLSGLGHALFYACCHVSSLPKLSGLETACLLLNARCSSLQSFGARDFFKTLFTTFPFFSSSPPSHCPPATATLLRIAANCLLLKREERSEFGLFL